MLAGFFKLATDKRNPFGCRNLLQEHHVSELVERHALVIENLLHQMTLATEHAIVYSLLVLPDRTQLLLKRETVRDSAIC